MKRIMLYWLHLQHFPALQMHKKTDSQKALSTTLLATDGSQVSFKIF
jgi:hypothetical protein